MRRVLIGATRFVAYNKNLRTHLTEDEGERGNALCGRAWINKTGWRHSVSPAPDNNTLCTWCWRVDEGLSVPSPTALANRARWTNRSAKPADNN